jgi:hypothetical protein
MVVTLYREAIEYFSNAIPSSELDLSFFPELPASHSFVWLEENGFEATLVERSLEAS